MKNKIFLLGLFSLIVLIIGCTKTDKLESGLTGTWIEITEKNDTIDFTHFTSSQAVNLRRGYEMRGEYWQIKGGMYLYKVLDSDSIAIGSIWSSSCPGDPACYPHYLFKLIDNETFNIGNFYNRDISPNEILTFSRID